MYEIKVKAHLCHETEKKRTQNMNSEKIKKSFDFWQTFGMFKMMKLKDEVVSNYFGLKVILLPLTRASNSAMLMQL